MKVVKSLVCAGAMLCFSLGVEAAVLHVPSEHPTIQAGIDAAVTGDIVLVADGTYTGDGNRDIDFGGKSIVVRSENGPEMTVIDCQGTPEDPHRGFYFHTNEESTSVVQGFTIVNGWAYLGGAILCCDSSPTILNNVMMGNTAEGGGAIMCRLNSHATIVGNTITQNHGSACGGGIYCLSGSSVSIVNNLITENTALYCGGGIRCNESSPMIAGNTLVGNTTHYGGGICALQSSFPTVLNCILWGDSARFGREVFDDGTSSVTVTYSDVEGGKEGEGNLDADPLFVSGPQGDYYLSQIDAGQPEESPCVNRGDLTSPVPNAATRTDEVSDIWPVDMGYHYPIEEAVQADEEPLGEVDTPTMCLAQNYPNPFSSATAIAYSLPDPAAVRIAVYDIRGALISTLASGRAPAGRHRVIWDGTDRSGHRVGSGVYFYCLSVDHHKEMKRMVILR